MERNLPRVGARLAVRLRLALGRALVEGPVPDLEAERRFAPFGK